MPTIYRRAHSAALVAVCLAVAGCGEGSTGKGEGAPTASPAGSAVPSPAAAASPTVPPSPKPTFDISYAAGRVSGVTGRLKVALGTKVTVRVASDVADEVHLHGYDVKAAVAPEQPGVIAFTASIPGVFTLELEQRGTELAKIQVQ